MSLLTQTSTTERPRGIEFIAALALLTSLGSALVALLNLFAMVPLASGAPILVGGLEIYGPYAFLIYSALTAAIAYGLLRLQNWARRAAVILLFAGVVLVTPAISMAVADGRIFAIAREGLQIIVRTACLWYLFQGPVRDAFE